MGPGCVKTGWRQLTKRNANWFHFYLRIFTNTYEISHAVKSPSLTRSPLCSDSFKRRLFLLRCPSPIIVNVACIEGMSPFDFPVVPVNEGRTHPKDRVGGGSAVAGWLRYESNPE